MFESTDCGVLHTEILRKMQKNKISRRYHNASFSILSLQHQTFRNIINKLTSLVMQPDHNSSVELSLQLTEIHEEFYLSNLTLAANQWLIDNFRYKQTLLIVIEPRTSLDKDSCNTLKRQLCSFLIECAQKSHQAFLVWNSITYDLVLYPTSEQIKNLIEGLSVDAQNDKESQLSYKATLDTIRHNVQNLSQKLPENSKLTVLFVSSQLPTDEILMEGADEVDFAKWLYCVNKHKQNIELETKRLRNQLGRLNSVVHTVGFGKYHHTTLLSRLARIGRSVGRYFYTASQNELNEALEGLLNSLFNEPLEISISLQGESYCQQKKQKPLSKVQVREQERVKKEEDFVNQMKEREDEPYKIRFPYNYSFTLALNEKQTQYASVQPVQLDEGRLQNIRNGDIKFSTWASLKNQRLRLTPDPISKVNPSSKFQYNIQRLRLYSRYLLVMTRDLQKCVQSVRFKNEQSRYEYKFVFDHIKAAKIRNLKNNIKTQFDLITMNNLVEYSVKERRKILELADKFRSEEMVFEETLAQVFQSHFSQNVFAKLQRRLNGEFLKRSLKKKLLKRMNANPHLIQETENKVSKIVKDLDLIKLQADHQYTKKDLGNCVYSGRNFVEALKNEDCLAVMFEMLRPDTAIADPGRLQILGCSFKMVSAWELLTQESTQKKVAKYVDDFENQVEWLTGCPLCDMYYRKNPKLETTMIGDMLPKHQRWRGDYSFDPTNKVIGLIPLWICPQNWQVARLMMKLCLGWTTCQQPLAYSFSQLQLVPFMVLARAIEDNQLLKFKINSWTEEALNAKKQQEYYSHLENRNKVIEIQKHMQLVVDSLYMTCYAIIKDLGSHPEFEPFSAQIYRLYSNYSSPINRTIDVISNNYAFIAQLVTALKFSLIPKIPENEFHEFFKRVVEEELRRQTYRWKEETEEDAFINKMLNVEVQKMDKPQIVVTVSNYKDKFYKALEGQEVPENFIQRAKNDLEMIIKKEDKFNDTQRFLLIEYKRLYEKKCLVFWYMRGDIYGLPERREIHRWRCVGLANSYQLFCMIIQNKTQGKNSVRRDVILRGEYVDPFDYYAARQFLEDQYLNLRQKVEAKQIKAVRALEFKNNLDAFCMTPDLVEAAGALLGANTNNFKDYFETLLGHHTELFQKKMQMLIKGEFQGVYVTEPHGRGYIPSKKANNMMQKKRPYDWAQFKWMF